MKGIHIKRQSRYLNDLDNAIDRLMAVYFTTTKLVSTTSNWTTTDVLDDLTIEVNNVRSVAQMASGNLHDSAEELIRMIVLKTTHCMLESLSDLFTSSAVEDMATTTVFTLYTDRNRILANQDRAYFLMMLRSNSLLNAYNVKLTIMDGASKVAAA